MLVKRNDAIGGNFVQAETGDFIRALGGTGGRLREARFYECEPGNFNLCVAAVRKYFPACVDPELTPPRPTRSGKHHHRGWLPWGAEVKQGIDGCDHPRCTIDYKPNRQERQVACFAGTDGVIRAFRGFHYQWYFVGPPAETYPEKRLAMWPMAGEDFVLPTGETIRPYVCLEMDSAPPGLPPRALRHVAWSGLRRS